MITKRHKMPDKKHYPLYGAAIDVGQHKSNSILCFRVFATVHLHKQKQTHRNNASNLKWDALPAIIVTRRGGKVKKKKHSACLFWRCNRISCCLGLLGQ